MTRQSTTGPLASGALRTRTRLTALTAVLCAAAALAGCSGGDGTTAAESTAPTLTASAAPVSTAPADPEAEAKASALTVYRGFWQEMQALYADRNGTTKGLEQYAASETLSKAESDAQRAHAQGRIYLGKVTFSDAVVTKTELDSTTPRVTLSSCLDVSRWQPVDAETRVPVTLPADRITKYQVLTTVEKWPQGWRVVRDEPQGKKC
ncbi:hypothetical protein [Streptomyces sp. NBC_01334]|uniref:hypothetical protein n=1 Tax=Streptomyces sp. NBC_01334 TaxID=2903827 RepID=UPI002E0D5B50|nr:hypothetical protein OG736_44560 [Streptomyces sp. NBC_01334]